MNFTYKADGTVTGFNRAGVGDELTGVCSPQDLVWDMDVEAYTAVSGDITPKTQAEVDAILLGRAKEGKRREIVEYCEAEDRNPFVYNGVTYKMTDALETTYARCSRLQPDDPIPCNGGMWDSYDGTVSTPFTVSEFADLFDYAYDIPAHNYENMKAHIYAMMQLTTIEEVENYDYSTNWR